MIIRNLETGARVCEFPHPGGFRAVAANADGSRFVMGGADQKGWLLDAATGKVVFEPFEHASDILVVDFSPDGSRTLTGDFYGTVQVRDAAAGDLIREFRFGSRAWGVRFSPDSARFAVGNSDKLVRVVDMKTWQVVHRLAGHASTVPGLAFSPDGTLLATGSHDNMIRIWDAATGEPRSAPMPHRGPIWYPVTLAFSPDGRTIATGSDDRTVRVWDIATSKPIGPALRHEASVRMVAFSSDAQIRTGTAFGTVRFWNPTMAPLEGDAERVTLWIQVRTGLELDAEGSLRSLDAGTWERRRARLLEFGGAPGGE